MSELYLSILHREYSLIIINTLSMYGMMTITVQINNKQQPRQLMLQYQLNPLVLNHKYIEMAKTGFCVHARLNCMGDPGSAYNKNINYEHI